MRVGGWRPFWAALFAALLLFLPLAGGTILLTRSRLRQSRVQAAESQSGVPVTLPKETDRLALLLCVAADEPEFLLLYLNASQNCINLLAVPSTLAVPFGEGTTTLTSCYAAAGPARCREALAAAFALPEDTRYLALSPAVLGELAQPFGSISVSFLGALTAGQLKQAGLPGAAQDYSVQDAREALAQLRESAAGAPQPCAAAQAAVWDAFFRQKLELLPAALPNALRAHSSALLTDLTAQDYFVLEETLEFLTNNAAPVQSAALPGSWDAAGGCYASTEASAAAVQALFNVSPTSGQAASESAP